MKKLYLEKYQDVVGSLAVVTFENVDLSLFRDRPTRSTCRLWRLGYHMRLCGKTRLRRAVNIIQVLENTVKLLRCKEAHLTKKCSDYCNERP